MGHIAGSERFRGSIWIRPTGLALDAIQHAIHGIKDAGDGPPVPPHVTVIGGIEAPRLEAERKLRQLAGGFMPFNVKLDKLDWTNQYYRCFFARVEASAELLALHRRARELFSLQTLDTYEPHVSLLYGQIDEAHKKMLAVDLGGRLQVAFRANSIHLVDADPRVPVPEWSSTLESELDYQVKAATSVDTLQPAAT